MESYFNRLLDMVENPQDAESAGAHHAMLYQRASAAAELQLEALTPKQAEKTSPKK
jgi:hypothetical protein